jgi:hypothetical protein
MISVCDVTAREIPRIPCLDICAVIYESSPSTSILAEAAELAFALPVTMDKLKIKHGMNNITRLMDVALDISVRFP